MIINGYTIEPNANLKGANLTRAHLLYVNLTGANFEGANLTGANFEGANLTGASFTGAYCRGAEFRDANLTGADFTGAYCRETALTGANLTGADFTGAYLAGANLRGANLQGVMLNYCVGNGKEILTLQTAKYHVVYTADTMAIGCKQFTNEEWWGFSDKVISEMDYRALDWWKVYKPILQALTVADPLI
jgi:hypothetical protein